MAKIFSLQVRFSNQCYTALVSAGNEAAQPYLHIQFPKRLIVGSASLEHIRYKGFCGYKRLQFYNDPSLKNLLEKLAPEIEHELSNRWAVVRQLTNSFG